MNHTHYNCPACDGTGDECTWCDESGIVDALDLDMIPHNFESRPHSPSNRRWHGFRAILRTMPDPLDTLAKQRASVIEHKTGGARAQYQKAFDRMSAKLSHAFCGLAQADMLARATMCENAASCGVQAWRAAA